MAKYYRQSLLFEGGHFSPPPVEPLTALRPMLRARASAVMRAQDKLVATSRRIVCRFGLAGSSSWRVPGSDPDNTVTQDYPDSSTEYVCGRSLAELTPGCMYRLVVVCVPAGATQYFPMNYDLDSVGGSVLAEIVWNDAAAGSATKEAAVTLPPSTLEFGGESTDAGGLFSTMRRLVSEVIVPADIEDVDEANRFSLHVTAELTLKVVGGARVVDAILIEEPYGVAFEADDASDLWTSHIFASPIPNSFGAAMPYPLQRGSENTPDGDRRRGTWHSADVAAAQQLRLGPALMQATAFSEDDATSTSTLDPWSISNAWTRIPDLVATNTYDALAPGWSVGSGGYAQSWDQGSPLVLRDRVAVIPVFARVYGSMAGGAETGTIRFQTAHCSYVDVAVAGTTDQWWTAFGWLEVGITPEQPVPLQVFANSNDAVNDVVVDSLALHYGGQWKPRA